ncbi:MAG: cob(I)yrinic acid a,c-diamide adenosyltransferase [Fimbriimonadaceae bacterium]|nr:cob(I)yrinic acid a,c-diamide adenosyltransferase [Fimbriimonadaceae bacterium]
MKIYTRTGDAGQTGLLGGARVDKHSLRISAIGDVDELNAAIGMVVAAGACHLSAGRLRRVQSRLFDLGAELALPADSEYAIDRLTAEDVAELEGEIDSMEATLPELKNFILPGGSAPGAAAHHARAVCRRAERSVLLLHAAEPFATTDSETVPTILQFINRLSDWLFVLARFENEQLHVPETIWSRSQRP